MSTIDAGAINIDFFKVTFAEAENIAFGYDSYDIFEFDGESIKKMSLSDYKAQNTQVIQQLANTTPHTESQIIHKKE